MVQDGHRRESRFSQQCSAWHAVQRYDRYFHFINFKFQVILFCTPHTEVWLTSCGGLAVICFYCVWGLNRFASSETIALAIVIFLGLESLFLAWYMSSVAKRSRSHQVKSVTPKNQAWESIFKDDDEIRTPPIVPSTSLPPTGAVPTNPKLHEATARRRKPVMAQKQAQAYVRCEKIRERGTASYYYRHLFWWLETPSYISASIGHGGNAILCLAMGLEKSKFFSFRELLYIIGAVNLALIFPNLFLIYASWIDGE